MHLFYLLSCVVTKRTAHSCATSAHPCTTTNRDMYTVAMCALHGMALYGMLWPTCHVRSNLAVQLTGDCAKDAARLMQQLDKDKGGTVSVNEFLQAHWG